jgi:hypothetical protein
VLHVKAEYAFFPPKERTRIGLSYNPSIPLSEQLSGWSKKRIGGGNCRDLQSFDCQIINRD